MMDKKAIYKKLYNKYIWYREVLKRHNHTRIGPLKKLRAIKYGYSSDFYRLYNLDKNSPDDYISEYKRILSRDIDGDYKLLLDDKLLFTEFFSRMVKVPAIEYYIKDGLYDKSLCRTTFEGFITDFKGKKYILKPNNGGGGHGVHIIEEKDGIFIDYKPATVAQLEDLIKKSNNSIINEYITQHEYASEIFPHSVNTIRLITIRDPETGESMIPCAAHRFGNSNTGAVDNVSSGGYVTQIDIETGTLGESRKTSCNGPIRVHPDTGKQIYGTRIPHWDAICKDVLSASKACPYLPFIAWDIAVTEDSYVALEANASCSLELFQMFGSIKGSKLWDFYKYYGIVR